MCVPFVQASKIDGALQQAPQTKLSASADTTITEKPVQTDVPVLAMNTASSAATSSEKTAFRDLFVAGSSVSSKGTMHFELNPMAISFVEDYVTRHGQELEKMKDWGKPYFDMIDEIFAKYDIPRELKYLAVIESNLRASTVSWAGAVGPWQFMPSTARLMGLKVTSKVDERRNYVKSTHAAAKYLKQLYNDLGDWLLVIAAYNGGPGRVTSAIRRSGSDNFWKLQYNLPAESRNHVKKFIATHFIMEGRGGVTTSTKTEIANRVEIADGAIARADNTRVQQVSGKYNSLVIAKVLTMDINEFNALNPQFDSTMAEGKSYDLRLPDDKMDLFNAHKYQILSESVQMMLNKANMQSPTTAAR